ncbi:hypothetical protein NDA12_001444 [Ustilago hordei]|nr:hypothetical protein NDA15_000798 [Ustilago hordei]KAJ1579566.1 hypothetical protein NDA12_001444 [Ustilago hordei]
MGAAPSKPDPYGLYAHAYPPPLLPTSMAKAEGPTEILVYVMGMFAGANASLFFVYFHLFGGLRSRSQPSRDPYLLQLAVLISVLCNLTLAIVGFVCLYNRALIALYSKVGFDTNAIEWYVPLYHTMQAIPGAIGQLYFVARIAKLFDVRKKSTRIGVAVATVGITAQFVLMIWFGAAFYAVRYKHRLLDPSTRHWVKGIISAWAIIFVLLEISTTLTTIARLIVLRRQTSMDAARRVLFNLGVYSLQGQVVLATFSLTSFYLFSTSVIGWYTPIYLLSGALYTTVLLANLIYRQAVSTAMHKATSDYSPSADPERQAQRNFDFNAVCTYRSGMEQDIQMEETGKTEDESWQGGERRFTGFSSLHAVRVGEVGHAKTFSEGADAAMRDDTRLFRSDPGTGTGTGTGRVVGRPFAVRASPPTRPAPLVMVTKTTSLHSSECVADQ